MRLGSPLTVRFSWGFWKIWGVTPKPRFVPCSTCRRTVAAYRNKEVLSSGRERARSGALLCTAVCIRRGDPVTRKQKGSVNVGLEVVSPYRDNNGSDYANYKHLFYIYTLGLYFKFSIFDCDLSFSLFSFHIILYSAFCTMRFEDYP